MVAMRRRAERLREGARKMVEAEINELGESCQRNVFRKMLLDEFYHALLLPRGQAATNRPCRSRCSSLQSKELMHQHET